MSGRGFRGRGVPPPGGPTGTPVGEQQQQQQPVPQPGRGRGGRGRGFAPPVSDQPAATSSATAPTATTLPPTHVGGRGRGFAPSVTQASSTSSLSSTLSHDGQGKPAPVTHPPAASMTPADPSGSAQPAREVSSGDQQGPAVMGGDSGPPREVSSGRGQSRSLRGAGRGLRGRGSSSGAGGTAAAAPPPSTGRGWSGSGDAAPAVPPGPAASSEAGFSLAELSSALFAHLPPTGSHSTRDNLRGTLGRDIRLRSNCFALALPDAIWHKFDVEIHRGFDEEQVELKDVDKVKEKNRIQSRELNRRIMLKLFDDYAREFGTALPAYDGRKIMVTSHKPNFTERMFQVEMPMGRRNDTYTVRLKHTLMVDVTQVKLFYQTRQAKNLDPEIVQAVNIAIDSSFGRNRWVAVGRSYYDPSLKGFPLGLGMEMRSGVYTSAVYAEWGPILVLDKARTAFIEAKPLIQMAADILGMDVHRFQSASVSPANVQFLSKELKNIAVRLLHSGYGRTVKIAGVTQTGANRTRFKLSDGKECTVADYFRDHYPDFKLACPHLPCIEVKRANGTKTDYFPFETCQVKQDQPYRKKLNPDQTANMIRHAQEKPKDRIQYSIDSAREIKRTAVNELQGFNINISSTPIETTGKVLADLTIMVQGQSIKATQASWRLPFFHVGVDIPQWVLVDCAQVHPRFTNKLAEMLVRQGVRMKMNIRDPVEIMRQDTNWTVPATTKGMLRDALTWRKSEKDPFLVVIVMGRTSIYSEIKSLTETSEEFKGIVTQCVKAENVTNDKKMSPTFVDNLLKKINAKLGGVNSIIKDVPNRFKDSFMVIGADVSHPGPGDCMTPSIAAVVGSLDYGPSKYSTDIRVQCGENNNRIEYIVYLKQMIVNLLTQHIIANKMNKPKHLYYLRDGVSDGQFNEVRRHEVQAIREACYEVHKGYQPSVTVLIAQKRHHVRFSVTDPRDGTRSGNIPPGTYIDRDVVHPLNHDLYMYSHEGLIGTSRPTHYQVIHADVPITTNEVTELIYYLCHSYARTTKSVSIPAPIYYAHLAAFRAKEYVKADPTLGASSAASSDSWSLTSIDLERYQQACNVNAITRNLLFFA